MRHRVYGKKLGRNKNEREALFKSLVQALFTYGTIQTSETKAKAIKGMVDKVINLAKEKDEKRLQSFLINKDLRQRLIKDIVPKLSNRSSGYTSMVKLGTRLGDQTMMVRLSLIGAEKLEPIKKVIIDKVQVTSKSEQIKKVVPKKKRNTRRATKLIRSKVRARSRLSK